MTREEKYHYEDDQESWSDDVAYKVSGYDGIAWRVWGWETEPDEDTEWTGYEVRTGKIIAVMIGDDRRFSLDPDDVTPIPDDSFCRSCGQIGCGCNVYA